MIGTGQGERGEPVGDDSVAAFVDRRSWTPTTPNRSACSDQDASSTIGASNDYSAASR